MRSSLHRQLLATRKNVGPLTGIASTLHRRRMELIKALQPLQSKSYCPSIVAQQKRCGVRLYCFLGMCYLNCGSLFVIRSSRFLLLETPLLVGFWMQGAQGFCRCLHGCISRWRDRRKNQRLPPTREDDTLVLSVAASSCTS